MNLGYGGAMPQAEQPSRVPISATTHGRPRDSTIDDRATEAVIELLESGPYSALTMEGVAAAADTSKPALRRRWKSLPGIVVHTLISVLGTTPTPDTGCVHCDLVSGISNIVDGFSSSPITRALPGLLSDLEADPELRALFHREYFEARRATTRAVLDHAVERGDIRPGIDMELTLDLLAAPLYYRAFFGHQPLDRGVAERTVLSVLSGVATAEWQQHNFDEHRP
jgi:AcrR family transcriptional regulator